MQFSPVPKKILKQMGYLKDQRGIMNRYLRENKNWEDHLKHTENFVIEAMKKHRGEQFVVLGSGWLLDFPVNEALEIAGSIILADIVHPRQILHKYKTYNKISFTEADITGGMAKSVYFAIKNKKPVTDLFLSEPIMPASSPFPASSLVISLNILNQLDILIVDYMRRKTRLNEDEIVQARKFIQGTHLNFLKMHNYCLITDCTEKIINTRDKRTTEINTVYVNLPEGSFNSQWEWKFDTHHFYQKNARTHFMVKAVYQSRT